MLNWPRTGFYNPIYKNGLLFFLPKLTFQHHLHNTAESAFIENEISDLNSLKPFEFEPKLNTGDINSSSNDDEEEGAEYKVKRISNSEWCECSTNAVVGKYSSK